MRRKSRRTPPSRRFYHSPAFWTPTVLALVGVGSALFLRSHSETEISVRSPAALEGSRDLCSNWVQLVCEHAGNGAHRDPTGSVQQDFEGEEQALRMRASISRAHPTWSAQQVDDALVELIYTPKRKARLESAFVTVKNSMERLIQTQPRSVFTGREKKALIQRISALKLELPPPASLYENERQMFTKAEVFYERLTNGLTRLRVGGAYLLNSRSWFNLIFTLAHETAHAIDPCEIRSSNLSLPTYDRLTACFLRGGLIAARRTRAECAKDDQLAETFADWVAVQVTAEALHLFSTEFKGPALVAAVVNSVRDLCEQDGAADNLEYHPPPKVRIEGIFGANPRIRELLGCGPLPENAPSCQWAE